MTALTAIETDETAYRNHERIVLAMLATRYREIDPDGRRELYHDAWASVLKRRSEGAEVVNLRSYLLGAADKLATKRVFGADSRRRLTFDPTGSYFNSLPDSAEPPDEAVLAVDEARRVRMLVDELGPGEQAILKLRIEQGLEPSEIRDRLGLTDRQYRRGAERATKALLEQFRAFDTGEWARGKRSLLCACVMGIASQRQREKAERLVHDDPCCRAMLSELRQLSRSAAGVMPMPTALSASHAHESLVPHVADLKARVAEALSGVKRQAVDILTTTKHHAATTYVRAGDPTPITGARPGAAVAVLASCMAAGSGAYCAVQGLPEQIKPVLGVERSHAGDTQASKRAEQGVAVARRASPTPAPPVIVPQPPQGGAPAQAPAPQSTAPAPTPTSVAAPPPQATPETEFEPTARQASPGAAPVAPSASARAPRGTPAKTVGGSGEFAP